MAERIVEDLKLLLASSLESADGYPEVAVAKAGEGQRATKAMSREFV
jgi:hypothetical protein